MVTVTPDDFFTDWLNPPDFCSLLGLNRLLLSICPLVLFAELDLGASPALSKTELDFFESNNPVRSELPMNFCFRIFALLFLASFAEAEGFRIATFRADVTPPV